MATIPAAEAEREQRPTDAESEREQQPLIRTQLRRHLQREQHPEQIVDGAGRGADQRVRGRGREVAVDELRTERGVAERAEPAMASTAP